MLSLSDPSTGELQGMDWQMSKNPTTGAWGGHITWWHDNTGTNMWGPYNYTPLTPDSNVYNAYCYTAYPS
jgi:hypothetical protein